jgi:hypothetical protein
MNIVLSGSNYGCVSSEDNVIRRDPAPPVPVQFEDFDVRVFCAIALAGIGGPLTQLFLDFELEITNPTGALIIARSSVDPSETNGATLLAGTANGSPVVIIQDEWVQASGFKHIPFSPAGLAAVNAAIVAGDPFFYFGFRANDGGHAGIWTSEFRSSIGVSDSDNPASRQHLHRSQQ